MKVMTEFETGRIIAALGYFLKVVPIEVAGEFTPVHLPEEGKCFTVLLGKGEGLVLRNDRGGVVVVLTVDEGEDFFLRTRKLTVGQPKAVVTLEDLRRIWEDQFKASLPV